MTHNFIISNNKLILQDYNAIKYNDKYIYYHNDLPIFLGSINSNTIIILGFAYRIDTITDDLLFECSSLEKVLELLSGKFLIIYNNKLYVDFYNSFDIFFSKKLNLITNDITFIDANIEYDFLDKNEDKLDNIFFNLSPFLKYKNIYKLPFGFSLDIVTFKLEYVSLMLRHYDNILMEDILNLIRKTYPNIIANIQNKFPICLSLSGGIDSRACLTLMLEQGYNFTIINWDREDRNLPDKIIPRIICDKYKLKLIGIEDFDSKYIVILGYDFDIFHSALKDRKNYRDCKTEREILDLYIPNDNTIFKKNRKFYELYVKDKLHNFHIFDRIQLYFYIGNCIAPMMKVDSMGGMNCISLFNNYKICRYMLQFFKYRIHEISLRICESNKFLWNLPFNSLNKIESNEKIQSLSWSLNNTFLLNSESDIWT